MAWERKWSYGTVQETTIQVLHPPVLNKAPHPCTSSPPTELDMIRASGQGTPQIPPKYDR